MKDQVMKKCDDVSRWNAASMNNLLVNMLTETTFHSKWHRPTGEAGERPKHTGGKHKQRARARTHAAVRLHFLLGQMPLFLNRGSQHFSTQTQPKFLLLSRSQQQNNGIQPYVRGMRTGWDHNTNTRTSRGSDMKSVVTHSCGNKLGWYSIFVRVLFCFITVVTGFTLQAASMAILNCHIQRWSS